MMNLTKFLLLFSLLSIFISCSKDDAASESLPPSLTLENVIVGKWEVLEMRHENGRVILFGPPFSPITFDYRMFNFKGGIEFRADSSCKSAYEYEFEGIRTIELRNETETHKGKMDIRIIQDKFSIVSDNKLEANILNDLGMIVYDVSDLTRTSFTLKASVYSKVPNEVKFDFTARLKKRD